MRLLTVGDSFTYGEELADLSSAWPFLLGNKLGYEVTNLAFPGSGNTRMVRHCVEQIDNYDMVIIAWSHFARMEVADANGFYDLWPGCNAVQYNDHSPWRRQLVEYYTRYYNDDYLYVQYLLNIILVQNYLKSNNKRYLMLDSFGNHQANQRNNNRELIKQINNEYYIGWPNKSMMEWTYRAAQGPRGHFLEEGHAIVADKVYEHIRNIGWLP
jgi:lysophospholipase L1-like esterase